MNVDRLIKLLLFMFVVSIAATVFIAYALFVALPRQRVIAQTGGCSEIYTVQQGDTLAGIAARCGVNVGDLMSINIGVTDETLEPGQLLQIPQPLAIPRQVNTQPAATVEPSATPQPTAVDDQAGGGGPTTQDVAPTDDQAGGGGPTTQNVAPTDDQVGGGAPGTSSDDQAGGGAPGTTTTRAASQGTRTYTVRAGDTMSAIAVRYGVPLQDLIEANPQIEDPNWIFPGDVLTIPATVPPTGDGDYIVRPGDTLSAIALRFGVNLNDLIAANPQISNPNLIYPGQAITIPDGGTVPPTGGTVYTVRLGDTMFSIARRYGVTLNALLAANPDITTPYLIFPGQQINIPDSGGDIPPTGGNVHIVQPGDTLGQIAWLYGTTVNQLLALNPQITDPDWIFPGQVIQLP